MDVCKEIRIGESKGRKTFYRWGNNNSYFLFEVRFEEKHLAFLTCPFNLCLSIYRERSKYMSIMRYWYMLFRHTCLLVIGKL